MYKSGWKYIDECIMKGRVVTCSEIMDEIKDLKIKKMADRCSVYGNRY